MTAGRKKEWTPERVIEAKKIYLAALAEGKTEDDINKIDGVPSWPYRHEWRQDKQFFTECQKAIEIGTEKELNDYERLQQEMLSEARTNAIPPHAITMLENIGKHKRWKAGKRTKTYSDKLTVSGDAENPLAVTGQLFTKIEVIHVNPALGDASQDS
jgi:hypothetical protein